MVAPRISAAHEEQKGTAQGRRTLAHSSKVLIFDSWTKGSIHIIRLLPHLRTHGIEPLFVHIGSWGDDPDRPEREQIEGLEVRDIRAYRGLDDILTVERPDVVLFLSLDPILHRAFNRYCQRRSIPTVNLYPGLWSAQAYDELNATRKTVYSYWKWASSRLGRFGRYVFPVYLASLVRTRASVREWNSFVREVFNKLAGRVTMQAPTDSETDFVCVYNTGDAEHARRKYTLPSENIVMVGVPDFMKFRGLEEAIGAYAREASERHDHVVYIGTGARGTRLRIPDAKGYYEHLCATADALKAHGKVLVCKLHYSRLEPVRELARDNDTIRFCDDDDFVRTLSTSCGAIVEPSTAALVPIVMGKPVYLARYGGLSGLPFGQPIGEYPKATPIDFLGDLAAITRPMSAKPEAVEAWIRAVAGPLPASAMPARVVDVIRRAMSSRARQRS